MVRGGVAGFLPDLQLANACGAARVEGLGERHVQGRPDQMTGA
jgi:hypothetical protein